MNIRTFTMIFGIFYTLVGILGFIPGVVQPVGADAPDMAMDTGYGLLLGLFPVNILHSIVHLLIGLWGVFASRSFDASRLFNRVNAVLFALLFLMGLIPGLNTTFGLIPLFSHDIWLHALTALLTGYYGYIYAADQPTVNP